MSPRSENWFDRLSAPHTRRQSLKTVAVAAAVGAGIPLAGKLPAAKAENASDCRKGCVWTVNQRFAARQRNNQVTYGFNEIWFNKVVGGPLGYIIGCFWLGARYAEADNSVRQQRAELQTCFQPFCPGFNSKAPGGPCDGCEPPLFCNPCELVDSGYICCIYEPGDCHGDCCHPGTGCP